MAIGDTGDPDRINFDGSLDAFGVKWCAEGVDGWDSPDQQLLLADRPIEDGQVHLLGRYSGRPLDLLNPMCFAPNDAARAAALDRLARTTQLVRTTRRLVVTEASVSRFADVYRREPVRARLRPPIIDMRLGRLWPAVLDIPLVSVHAVKYDTVQQINSVELAGGAGSGVVATTNAGTYETPWVATITAVGWPGGTLSIVGPGNEPKVELAGVPAMTTGDSLVIDSAAHSITLNGVNRRNLSSSLPDWSGLAAPSASLTITRSPTTGSVTVSVVYRSAWI